MKEEKNRKNIKIKAEQLFKSFGTKDILCGVDLNVFEKETLVIFGCSGVGKSVLIKTMCGLLEPDNGDIFIDNINIKEYSEKGLMYDFGYLFQGGALFDSLKIWENVTFKLRNKNFEKSKLQEIALENLKIVGLNESCMNLYPSELSGGMQKRVSLARTICLKPSVVFFDEPTTGLDPITIDIINNLITKISQQMGITTVVITHDVVSAKKIADKVALLYGGKIIWYGDVKEIEKTNDPYIRQFIDGREVGPIRIR